MGVTLNEGQLTAVDAILSGANVFVTGEGGTGKSVAVREAVRCLRADGRKTVVCAPTGVAAQAIGGATVHSVFRFGLAPKVADVLEGVRPSKVVHEADTILIDEVGMVRRDLMDAIAQVVAAENEARAADVEEVRKPLQLVVVGDFSQLPPVVTPADEAALVAHYGPESAGTGFYAFEATGWASMDFEVCQLTEPMRQSDPTFVAMLNRARVGDRSCLPYFNRLAGRGEPPAGAVSIVARNKDAERVNLGRLAALKGKSETIRGDVVGEFRAADMAAPLSLELKVGARVMCLANDPDHGYVNGSTGTVVSLRGFDPEWVPSIDVRLDAGGVVHVVEKRWENVAYRVVEGADGAKRLEQTAIGAYTQYPLKLAWAVTYHKSQGQTLGAVSIDPGTFAAGQLYVGLSRATAAAGIWLTREIPPAALKADPAVVAFYKRCGWTAPAPAAGDEVPDLPARVAKRGKPKPKTEPRERTAPAAPGPEAEQADGLEAVQAELHELLKGDGRTWVRVYELVSRVYKEQLYRPAFRSFSAWVRSLSEREGVSEGTIWHRKSAGDFYVEWARGRDGAPALADGERLSEDNLNLVRKIAKADPGRGDELMAEMVDKGLSTKELRREWREVRSQAAPEPAPEPAPAAEAAPRPAAPAARASRSALSVSCADADAFEAVLRALEAAGIAVEVG